LACALVVSQKCHYNDTENLFHKPFIKSAAAPFFLSHARCKQLEGNGGATEQWLTGCCGIKIMKMVHRRKDNTN